MSNTRYLEIDSTYRNRTEYPKPSNFTVLISQSGTRGSLHAYDPICNSAPLITWIPISNINGNIFENSANTTRKFIAFFPVGTLNKSPDYYIGQPITVNGEKTIITEWKYNNTNTNNDYFWLGVFPELSVSPSDTFTLEQSTDIDRGLFYVPESESSDNFYIDHILWNDTRQNGLPIISYNGNTHQIAINPDNIPNLWNIGDTYIIRREAPIFTGKIELADNNIIILPSSASTLDNIYTGSFIRVSGQNKKTCRILSYNGKTKYATVNCNLNDQKNDNFELLYFTRDNAVPFTYTGSSISQQEMVCYEIKLLNLILPNKILKNGGRICCYPYVYVELQNVSGSSAGTKNVIYSNNPNATRRLFRALITDTSNPQTSPFVKISGNDMVQTIKFKPNDNFKFGVYLPDGTPFETIFPERLSPSPPQSSIQISAIFSFKRLKPFVGTTLPSIDNKDQFI